MNIGILNMNKGNLKSLFQVLNRVDKNVNLYIINKLNNLGKLDKLILSGQTNSLSYLTYLVENSFIEKLINFSKEKFILGICAAFQLNFLYNQENNNFCLNNETGIIKKFLKKNFLKKPYIGWNKIKLIKINKDLNKYNLKRFYFSNSFYLIPNKYENIYFISKYFINFPVYYKLNKLILTQFHPEKSSKIGLNFFKNFINNKC